jgi:hypothetical protein
MNRFPDRLAASVKRAVRSTCIALILIPTVSCRGASPDWNGTWKLDPAKSDIPGPTIVVSITPDGMWHNSGSSGTTANFRCDGKRYQATDILTVYCTQVNSSDVEITDFKNESKVFTAHWELSPDGKLLSVKSTNFLADGSVKTKERRYARTSGLIGFAGGWKNVNPLEGIPSIRKISLQRHILHQSFPEDDRYMDVTLDGTDAAIHGRFTAPSATLALEEHSPREFSSTMKLYGQVVSVGYWQISADGRSLTESYWVPSRPNEKVVLAYEKQ